MSVTFAQMLHGTGGFAYFLLAKMYDTYLLNIPYMEYLS